MALISHLFALHNLGLNGYANFEVIIMEYENMNSLLEAEPEARQYFDSLPDYVRSQIQTRAQNVNSLESLRDYAENLTRGDD